MKRSIALAVVLVLLVAGGLTGVKVLQIRKLIAAGAAFVPPPESVSSIQVRPEAWRSSLSAIGSLSAVQGVTLTPDIPGTVREIAFESGAVVKDDDLLVRLDTSSEEAQLRAIQAQLELARTNLERVTTLRAENTVSQAELDAAASAVKQLKANADTIQTTIQKKTIRAPFAGRLGIRQVNLGQYLEAGKPIVSLQALDHIYADFSLPQQDLARLKTGMPVRITTDTYPGSSFEGALTAINPALDSVTRSVTLQATLENPGQALRPGMFVRAEVLLPEQRDVLVIPATAVLSAPYGDSVYVLETMPATNQAPAQLVVRQQLIRTGAARGDFVAVESGLKAGDRIVSSGLFKLRNGMAVVENNELSPKATETPRPAES
jgi:membrane fusion protein (multidrug efflux system)